MSIAELSTAIMTRYNSASGATLRAANTGGLWRDKAPQGTVPPYATFSFPASGTAFVQTNQTHDIRNVQFSIWHTDDNASSVTAIADLLKALYDDQILAMATKTMVYANRIGENLLEDTEKGWVCYIQYEYRTG